MDNVKLEKTLDTLVSALCADYDRRERVLTDGATPYRYECELRYLNSKIYEAAQEIVGTDMCREYVREIGNRTGYSYSAIVGVSETTYKNNKGRIKLQIARKLHLIN